MAREIKTPQNDTEEPVKTTEPEAKEKNIQVNAKDLEALREELRKEFLEEIKKKESELQILIKEKQTLQKAIVKRGKSIDKNLDVYRFELAGIPEETDLIARREQLMSAAIEDVDLVEVRKIDDQLDDIRQSIFGSTTGKGTPRNVPLSARDTLPFDLRPGYMRRVVNDLDNRVNKLERAGWSIVMQPVNRKADFDAHRPKSIGTGRLSVGNGIEAVLMEVPLDYYIRYKQEEWKANNAKVRSMMSRQKGEIEAAVGRKGEVFISNDD